MKEKILENKKNGMLVLILTILGLILATVLMIIGAEGLEDGDALSVAIFIIGSLWLCIGWLPFMGLKILKPQEALVLTLFGKYIGTIKGEGYYAVNPFCSSVNPAANTMLNQSGDVNTVHAPVVNSDGQIQLSAMTPNNKLSLKIMTLNNNRQKINDCLGNPVEIGIAVTWRIVDTAKAVFSSPHTWQICADSHFMKQWDSSVWGPVRAEQSFSTCIVSYNNKKYILPPIINSQFS